VAKRGLTVAAAEVAKDLTDAEVARLTGPVDASKASIGQPRVDGITHFGERPRSDREGQGGGQHSGDRGGGPEPAPGCPRPGRGQQR
jgi:hypothetical protein